MSRPRMLPTLSSAPIIGIYTLAVAPEPTAVASLTRSVRRETQVTGESQVLYPRLTRAKVRMANQACSDMAPEYGSPWLIWGR